MAIKPPTTEEEIMAWEPLIKKIGITQGIPPHELDDFFATVVLEWFKGGYLSKYDPNKGAFSTYLWSFIRKRAMRDRDRGQRDTRHLYESEIADEVDEYETGGLTKAPADPIDHFQLREQSVEMRAILEQIREDAPVLEVVKHVIRTKDGETKTFTIERSLYTLTLLLLQGYNQREIALIYRRSIGTVGSMITALRRNKIIIRTVLQFHPHPNLMLYNARKK